MSPPQKNIDTKTSCKMYVMLVNELRVGILSLEHFGTHEAGAQKPLRDQCTSKHKQIPTTHKAMFSIMKNNQQAC